MKSLNKITVSSLIALMLSACANPLSLNTASMYAQDCHEYQNQNEWWKARRACARAVASARLGGAHEQAIALLWYEYGRTSGAICDYAEAKRGFEEAIKIDEASDGPVYLSLLELARMNHDQGKFSEAASYYEKFWLEVPLDTAEKQDPIGAAEVLEEQAETYSQIGKDSLARAQKDKAKRIRDDNPGEDPNTDRAPYGKYCNQRDDDAPGL